VRASAFHRRFPLFVLTLLLCSSFPSAGPGPNEESDPFRIDYVEETGVELMMLDVEVYDDDDEPLAGLEMEDFTLTINGRVRQIRTLDDLCACSDLQEKAVAEAEEASAAAAESLDVPASAAAEPMTYVLYINFGQLQQDGRVHALREARRWIAETMQAGDRVQIMAWSAQAGLIELSPVTGSKRRLLEAIAEADRSPELVDPLPALRPLRQQEVEICWRFCKDDCKHCAILATRYAQEERSQAKASFGALRHALFTLENEPGRKALIYFFQNDTMMPSQLFIGVDKPHVGDLVRTVDAVAADANRSRTAVAAAYAGSDPSPSAINVGASLADYTGGSYSRAAYQIPALTRKAGRGCRCLYRIGVEPSPRKTDRILNASVWVHDRRVPRKFRLQHLSGFDRWLRGAQAALATPELMNDLPLTASVTPLAKNENGSWSVALQVVVSADALYLLPATGEEHGSWETGAILYREHDGKAQEFLARSRLSAAARDLSGNYIVHQRLIEELRPGSWRLGAFVRDRNANLFGSAEAGMVLPNPGRAGLSTPLLMRTGRSWVLTELPFLNKKDEAPAEAGKVLKEPLPLSTEPVIRGETLELRTWICAPEKGGGERLLRYLVMGDEPLFRLDHTEPPPSGSCSPIVDRIDTRFLSPGEYAYRIRYSAAAGGEIIEKEASFILQGAPAGRAPSSSP
jgi:hypothetical protein